MIAEILITGDEIRTGAVLDSNSSHIAQTFTEAGIDVVRHTCTGDDMAQLVNTIKEISTRADVAVVTGGLGPTEDDITAAAAAEAAGVDLVVDRSALRAIEDYFAKIMRPMSNSNKKQAMLPRGSECLSNPVGTAPGFLITINRCLFFFLPGVPFEMRRMLSDSVLPRAKKRLGSAGEYSLVKTISTFGLTESETSEQLVGLNDQFQGVKLGMRARFPEIHIRLYGRGIDEKGLHEQMEKASEWILKKIDKRVVSLDGSTMEAVVGQLLSENKATLAVAESCTGGLISHWLTNVPGSSNYFLFSGITYSNASKINVLDVSAEIIERYGAVHEETVKKMADGVRRIAGATYGLATSGIAGPDGGTEDKPVGTVCIGLATPHSTEGYRFFFPFGKRLRNKKIFAMTALDVLRQELSGSIIGVSSK